MSDRLVEAAWNGDVAAVRAFIAEGDDPNEPGVVRYQDDGAPRTFLGLPLSAAREHLAVIEALLDHGASLDATHGMRDRTVLHNAALNGHRDAVKLLLARGADPNVRDGTHRTPLHHVARSHPSREHAVDVAHVLLAGGADPRAKDHLGKMPSGAGDNEAVRKVLQRAAAKARPPAPKKPPKPIAPEPPSDGSAPAPHAILKGALERATPEELPVKPPHLGIGPTMSCPAIGTIRIGLWMARLVLPFVRAEEQETAAGILALVERFLEDVKDRALYKELNVAATDARRDSPALGIIRRAAGSSASMCRGKQDLVWTGARGAAQRMVSFLRDSLAAGLPTVREFLAELDRRILAAEMTAALQKLKPQPVAVVAVVLWRGTEMWIGRLQNGEHAFVGKLKGKWTWSTGTLSDAIACVPDNWFAIATAFVADC